MPRILTLVLLAVTLTLPLHAADLSSLHRVLVPVVNPSKVLTGANGSIFTTDLGLLTPRFAPITFYPTTDATGLPRIGPSVEQILMLPLWEAPVIAKGRFLFLDDEAIAAPIFASVTAKASDGSMARTPLPVVRDEEALTGKATFGLLTNSARFGPPTSTNSPTFIGFQQRHTLRVYDLDPQASGNLEVLVHFRFAEWLILGSRGELRLKIDHRDYEDPSYPWYAEIDLGQSFGDAWCFPALHAKCASFDAILDIESVSPNARYYAFVSTTDNVTNHVAIYTPVGGH